MYSTTILFLACVSIVGLAAATGYEDWAKKECCGDGDCEADHSRCYKGKCLCAVGFIYSVGQMTCLSSCPKFHNSYHEYPEGGIRGNNAYIKNGTPDFCKDLCTEDPKCMSTERREDGLCHFHHVPPTTSNWDPEAKWVLYQRNCE